TNYGDVDLPTEHESAYSRFQFSLPVKRNGWGYFLKLLFGLYVATIISFIAFLIEPSHFDPRFGLGVGAIFAAVASQYVVSSALPETSTLTLVDTLHILSFIVILISISESTLSLKLFCSADPARVKASRLLDRWSFAGLGLAYIAASILLVAFYR